MEKRRKDRQQRRLTCEIVIEGKRHNAILRDVSGVGLFLQTRVKIPVGQEIDVVFPEEGERPELFVLARVARIDRLKAHFTSAGAGGIGVEVLESVPDLSVLLEDHGFEPSSPLAPDVSAMHPYKVKLREIGGAGSRTVTIQAPTKQAARSRALARAGRRWKVTEVFEG